VEKGWLAGAGSRARDDLLMRKTTGEATYLSSIIHLARSLGRVHLLLLFGGELSVSDTALAPAEFFIAPLFHLLEKRKEGKLSAFSTL